MGFNLYTSQHIHLMIIQKIHHHTQNIHVSFVSFLALFYLWWDFRFWYIWTIFVFAFLCFIRMNLYDHKHKLGNSHPHHKACFHHFIQSHSHNWLRTHSHLIVPIHFMYLYSIYFIYPDINIGFWRFKTPCKMLIRWFLTDFHGFWACSAFNGKKPASTYRTANGVNWKV